MAAPQPAPASFSTRLISLQGRVSPPSLPRIRSICHDLEIGNIFYFPQSPIAIPESQRDFLIGQQNSTSAYHKNVAYRPFEDHLTGFDSASPEQSAQTRKILRQFSSRVVEFLSLFLAPYSGNWKLDYASYRPIEEQGRPDRLHARNDLLHFDSFPTRPTNGARILRFFVNINPSRDRVWCTSLTFESAGTRFVKPAWLRSAFPGRLTRAAGTLLDCFGLRTAARPAYDQLMHRIHNAMKEDSSFQSTTPKSQWNFAPGSAWMVCTDCVSHSVLSGQHALEQTFLVTPSALIEPDRSPLAVLQAWAGRPLTSTAAPA